MSFIPQLTVINEHRGIRLEWNPVVVADLLHYEVEMSIEDNSHYQVIGTTTDTHFITQPLKAETVCYFKVYAWDINNNRTLASNEITLRA